MAKKANKEQLFQTLKDEVRKVEGVSGCGGSLEQLRVYLDKDTPEVRKAVLSVVGDRSPADRLKFMKTGPISAG